MQLSLLGGGLRASDSAAGRMESERKGEKGERGERRGDRGEREGGESGEREKEGGRGLRLRPLTVDGDGAAGLRIDSPTM